MLNIKFTNTKTRLKEEFVAKKNNYVSMYVCGVTPYAHSHIGHGRSYINFDVLYRFLQFVGYDVTYVRNVTDIDDKLLLRAQNEHGDQRHYSLIARHFEQAYQQDMQQLNCLIPDKQPRATQHINSIISFIQGLIDNESAYVIDNDVYFSVKTLPDYGLLSGKKIEELRAGVRINIDVRKQSPHDFALWKGNDQEQFFKAPWGYGRPGWHIECSAMAQHYLGQTIDIHCGGLDLIFPHHENERAQSVGLYHKPFVRYWLHNGLVNLDKEKMSKSTGNLLTLREIFKEINPMILRFYLLQHHYRTPIEFRLENVHGAQTAYKKLIILLGNQPTSAHITIKHVLSNPITHEVIQALADDLNTPRMFGVIFQHMQAIRVSNQLQLLIRTLMQNVLGFTLQPLSEEKVKITPEIETLLAQRKVAREEKNWMKADAIRDQLKALGYQAHDKKAEE